MAETARRSWTYEALLEEGHDAKRYEIVDGELVERSPLGLDGAAVTVRVIALLDGYVRANDLGRVYGSSARFRIRAEPRTERLPDISLVHRDRLAPAGTHVFPGAPDLAVEVLSPTDATSALARKADEYFGAGAREVWLVDPALRTVTVLAPDRPARAFSVGDALASGVLPDLRLDVAELFAER